MIYNGYESWEQMQNFSKISPKLCQLGQKNCDIGVDTTIKAMPHGSDKSPVKNRNKIFKKMTRKNLNIVKKTSLSDI